MKKSDLAKIIIFIISVGSIGGSIYFLIINLEFRQAALPIFSIVFFLWVSAWAIAHIDDNSSLFKGKNK